jgi:glycerol-3-phosphate cytidylyltransferase
MKIDKGIIAGNFDAIHPGYIDMFKQSREHCNYLVVALQDDPTIERPSKCKPVLSYDDRKKILQSIRYIDEVIYYNTEKELENILKNKEFNVRILGDDYIDKQATGQEYSEKIVYIKRDHGWSTTKYKNLICKSLHGENK